MQAAEDKTCIPGDVKLDPHPPDSTFRAVKMIGLLSFTSFLQTSKPRPRLPPVTTAKGAMACVLVSGNQMCGVNLMLVCGMCVVDQFVYQ